MYYIINNFNYLNNFMTKIFIVSSPLIFPEYLQTRSLTCLEIYFSNEKFVLSSEASAGRSFPCTEKPSTAISSKV